MQTNTIILIVIFTILGLSLLIAIYAWLSILIRLHKKISYEDAINFEMQEIKKDHLKWNIQQYNQSQIFQTIKTRYGEVDLYKFGNSSKIVIFVHGIWSNNRSGLKILDYFLARNYSVITYDNYGWGKSRDFGITTLGKKEALLLADVITFVQKKLHPSELVIYGESMGGGTVYNYLEHFGNKTAKKYVINAGYMSFFDNVIQLGKKQLWYFIYLGYLPLLLIFWLQKWPIKAFLSKNKLKKIPNLYHIHSKNDKLVAYKHIKKYLPYTKNYYLYKDHNVRHVLGWYDANQEHYAIFDKWLNIKREKSKQGQKIYKEQNVSIPSRIS